MASRVAKSRGYNGAKREEIHDLTWQWVTSSTASDLNSNRGLLLAQLDLAEQLYMKENWLPKESLVVTCFVALHPNLGAVTTQRNESMHPVIKAILNTQVTLETAFNNIRSELRRMHRLIREKEEESRTKRPRGVDFMAFQLLIGRVTIWAMERINPEWVEAVATAERIRGGEEIIQGPCRCEVVVRFGLPCRHFHHLLRAAIESFPIPITLLHPRWRLDGPESGTGGWQPHYYDSDPGQFDAFISHDHNRNRFVSSAAEQQALYERLPKEGRDVLTNQVAAFTKNVTNTHDALTKVKAGIPVELPKPPPTKKELWLLKKHDKADRRAATAAEAAEKVAKQRDKANKIPSSSAPPTVTPAFRPAPVIVVPASPPPTFSPPPMIPDSPPPVFDSPPPVFGSPTPPPPASSAPPKKKGGRPKGSKNAPKPQKLLPPTNPPPPPPPRDPTPPPVMTKSKREVKKKKIWEQASQEKKPKRRQRGATLDVAAVECGPSRKRSKAELRGVQAEEVEDRESQQKRIIESAFLVE